MKLSIIETGYFKLDGGAMFGVVPKQLWKKLNPPDDNNMCTWSMRCLLIEQGDQKILIDTGIGNKQDAKFMSHFEPHGDDSLMQSLAQAGVQADDITDVIITHLHFDHVGGAVLRDGSDRLLPTFPNATYWVSQKHYDWACDPNMREKASFLKENFVPLREHGVLQFTEDKDGQELLPNIFLRYAHGHTSHMITPHIHLPSGNVLIYAADLMPSSFHIRKPFVMSYDIQPLVTLQERDALYSEAIADNYYIFYEHDPKTAIGKLCQNEKGRYYSDNEVGMGVVLG